MKMLIYIKVLFFCTIVQSQIIEVNTFDTIDWYQLPKKIENATFCITDGKTGEIVELRNYKNGKEQGLFLVFKKSLGGRMSYVQKNYKNGMLHGYYKDSEKSGNYKKGKKHGLWEYYDDMGNYEKITYKNDKKHGFYYSESGDFKKEGNYKNGKKVGEWYIHDEFDNTKKIEQYKNGELIKEK